MADQGKLTAFRDRLVEFRDPKLILGLWKECQPKILVVTDGLSFNPSQAFGLTQFVSTLQATSIHGMLPKVVKASRGSDPNADVQGFTFDNATTGLTKARYDVVFILGINAVADGSASMPASEIDAVARFMQAGGGVFATGDHEALGSAISRDLPRVRSMRFWKNSDTPDISDARRLSTNVSGPNEVEDFNDQSDRIPQNLYPNFRTNAGNPGLAATPGLTPGLAHPLLQLAATKRVRHPVIEVFPDHPHEGECCLPTSSATTFALDGANVAEWPAAVGGDPLAPEVVARTMSHGTGFFPKLPLEPRAFIAICAYDGHLADVGRVVTDATWHHFVNVNLDGSGGGPGQTGLQVPGSPPTDSSELMRVRKYYGNLANWLMPETTRRCLRWPRIIDELLRYPLFEEIAPPFPPDPDPYRLVALGEQLVASLALHEPRWISDALLLDALGEAVGQKAMQRLLVDARPFGKLGPLELAYGALGGVTLSVIERLAELDSVKSIAPHKTFEGRATDAAKTAARKLVEGQRKELRGLDSLLADIQSAR